MPVDYFQGYKTGCLALSVVREVDDES